MIIYAFVMNVSVAGLFAAGLVPGLMVGFSLMAMTVYLSKKRNYPVASQRASFNEVFISFKGAILPLLTPIIILGGILAGIFTPTEAAAIAAGYAILISVFFLRTLNFKDIPKVLFNAALSSGMILFLVGTGVGAILVGLVLQTKNQQRTVSLYHAWYSGIGACGSEGKQGLRSESSMEGG